MRLLICQSLIFAKLSLRWKRSNQADQNTNSTNSYNYFIGYYYLYFYEIAMAHPGRDADYGRVDRGIRAGDQNASRTTTGVSAVKKYHQDRRDPEMDHSARDRCDQPLSRGGLQRLVLSVCWQRSTQQCSTRREGKHLERQPLLGVGVCRGSPFCGAVITRWNCETSFKAKPPE